MEHVATAGGCITPRAIAPGFIAPSASLPTTLLSLIGLGLSRMTATELGDVILSTDLDKEQTIEWLRVNLQDRDVPGFVKREVNKKLNI